MKKNSSLNSSQKITIAAFIGLFFVLYLGCEKLPKEVRELEKSRSLDVQYINIDQEIKSATHLLGKDDLAEIEGMNVSLEETTEDSDKIEILKKLSGKWYSLGFPIISGHYAISIAEIEETGEAWAIAGSTNYLALAASKTQKEKKHAQQKALSCFEKAISLNPELLDYKINQALCYVEMPPEDNPMKGIQMLLALEESNPEAASVHIQLGRLAIQTNQWEKALLRYEKALTLQPDNTEIHCYLAEIHRNNNNKEKFDYHLDLCNNK